jgi:hypothetical protein
VSSHSVSLRSGIPYSKGKNEGARATRSSVVPYLVFVLTVFTSMAAAAAAVVLDAPLLVVGLY